MQGKSVGSESLLAGRSVVGERYKIRRKKFILLRMVKIEEIPSDEVLKTLNISHLDRRPIVSCKKYKK